MISMPHLKPDVEKKIKPNVINEKKNAKNVLGVKIPGRLR